MTTHAMTSIKRVDLSLGMLEGSIEALHDAGWTRTQIQSVINLTFAEIDGEPVTVNGDGTVEVP